MGVTYINPYIYAGFSPLDLSPALWLDASDTGSITASGSPAKVSQWNDLSGNGRHATQSTSANQPTTGAATQNSKNILSFSASAGTYMETSSGFDVSTTGITLFVVSKANDTADFKVLIGQQDDGANLGRVWIAYDQIERPYSNLGGVQDLMTTGTTAMALHRITFPSGANVTKQIVRNAGAATTSASPRTLNASAGALRIGTGKGTPSAWFDGTLAEIIVYRASLSAAQISDVETYLNAKWAVY